MRIFRGTYHLLSTLLILLWAGNLRSQTELLYHLGDQAPDTSYAQLFQLANAYFEDGDFERARGLYGRLLDRNPGDPVVLNNRGVCHFRLGEDDRSLKDYSRALRLEPESGALYNNRGLVKSRQGKYEQAMEDYRLAIRYDPESGMAFNNLGVAYYHQRNFTSAKKCLELALEREGKSPMIYQNLGQILLSQNKPRLALVEYEKALKADPGYVAAYGSRARIFRDLGMVEEAMDACNKGLALGDRESIELLTLRGQLNEEKGNREWALEDFSKVLELTPGAVDARLRRGNIRQYSGDLTGALADYQEVLSLDPEHGKALANRGMVYARMGMPQRALQDLNQAEILGEEDHRLFSTRASVHLTLGNSELAGRDLAKALEANPQSAPALESTGILLLQTRDFAGALEKFDLAVKYAEDDGLKAQALFNRAVAKAHLGKHSDAMDDLTKANEVCRERQLKDAIQEFRLKLIPKTD